MTKLYLQAPGILANWKPDFPVELDTAQSLTRSLNNYWSLDAQCVDLISAKPSGNIVGGATPKIGQQGRGFLFDGTSGYVGLGVNAFSPLTNFGIVALVRPDVSVGPIAILSHGAGSFYLRINAGKLEILQSQTAVVLAGTTTLVAGVTYLVGVTWSSTNIVRLFINGIQDAFTTTAVALSVATESLKIGADQASPNGLIGEFFNGWIGSVALFKSAPTAQQIYSNPNQLLRPKQRDLYLVVNTGTANNLSGTSTESQSATGSATIGINMVAASVQRQSWAGAVTVSAQLSGTATATQQANGNLQVSIPLNGATIAQAIATASLAVGNALFGTTQQAQSGTGALNISITLSGTEIQQAYASGTLTNTAAGAIALVGTSAETQSATGILSIGDNLSGASLAISSATGNLTTLVPLAGATVQAQLASGGLTVTAAGVNLSGAAIQQQLATGTLTLRVNLNAQSVQQALNTGYLTSSGTLIPDPVHWRIAANGRTFKVAANGRTFAI